MMLMKYSKGNSQIIPEFKSTTLVIHSEKCDHLEKFTGKLSFLFNLMIDIGGGTI